MNAPAAYWCHQCRHEIAPTATFTCGVCGSEFIEQMEPGAAHEDLMDEDSPEAFLPFDMPPRQNAPPPNLPGGAPQPPQGGFRNLFDMLNGLLQQQQMPPPQAQQAPGPQPHFQFFPMGGGNNNFVFHANFGPAQGAPFPNPFGLLQQLFNGGGVQMGDYVLGENIDNLLNQLFQQQSNKGPPPASKEAVKNLTSKTLTEEQAKHYEECSICKGNFVETDEVKEMPCTHVYHPECIGKWLEQRNFCPMCRFELPTDDVDYERMKAEKSNQGPATTPQPTNQTPPSSGSSGAAPFPPNLDVD